MFRIAVSLLLYLASWTTTTLAFGGVSTIGIGTTIATTAPPRILVGSQHRPEHMYAHRLFSATNQQQQRQQQQQQQYQSQEKKSSAMSTKRGDTVPLGGDFAGLFATYDLNGGLIPVPEYYVPDSLLEWGQAPPGLEVLVSEDDNDLLSVASSESSSSSWKRYELTVLPETGCGIDNLEVLQKGEEVPAVSIQVFHDDIADESKPIVRTLTYPLPSNSQQHRIRVESTFVFSPRHDDVEHNDNASYRSRLAVDLLWDNVQHEWSPQTPLRLFLERQTSLASSQGTRADGGGLDGRTVSTWIGPVLRRYEKQLDSKNRGKWESATDEKRISPSDIASDHEMVVLPANLTLMYGKTTNEGEWCLQVGQIDSSSNTRLVVEHTWSTSSPFDEPNVDFWKEEGSFQVQ